MFAPLTALLILLSIVAHGKPGPISDDEDLVGVGITGVQHIGDNFNISQFYVDGNWAGNAGREGGGGGTVCCVMLPLKWNPKLAAEIRWSVADWSNEKELETKAGNYRSIVWKNYKAIVPIEKYERAEDLYVHFFSNGKVRAVSTMFGTEGHRHPIQRHDPKAADSATSGHLIDSMFSELELAEIIKKNDAEKSERGSWK